MPTVKSSPPNAILFIYDPTNDDADSPDYIEDQLTAATEHCISVGTRSEVDGDTEITLDIAPVSCQGLIHIFSGDLLIPGGSVAVGTSDLEELLELEVLVGKITVNVWVDDAVNPARVVVEVSPVAAA